MCDDKMGLEVTGCGLEQGQSLRRHNPRPSSRCSGWQKGLSARRGESGAAEQEGRSRGRDRAFGGQPGVGRFNFCGNGLGWLMAGLTVLPWLLVQTRKVRCRSLPIGGGLCGPSSTPSLVRVLVLPPPAM